VIFEDKHFLVIDKPSGMASHGGSGVSHGAIELLRQARPNEHLELVHRLDRDTSGVLVFAKTRAGLTGLQAAIRENDGDQAVPLPDGRAPSKARFDVNAPLQKSILQGGERMVRVSDGGKPSLTSSKMEQYPARLMQATLGTGRTHQIRVHAAHIGHPLAGDPSTATSEANKRFRELGLHRLFLHASQYVVRAGWPSLRFFGAAARRPQKISSMHWRLKAKKRALTSSERTKPPTKPDSTSRAHAACASAMGNTLRERRKHQAHQSSPTKHNCISMPFGVCSSAKTMAVAISPSAGR
jgi:23S rRNA pseudouridine955/2504/2580 synthase